jgi:hypothetical protein
VSSQRERPVEIAHGHIVPQHWHVRYCARADAEHKAAQRQYAHVHHRPHTICVAQAFDALPEPYQRGLLAHEVGHLLLGEGPHSEAAADAAVRKALGVRVRYKDTRWGERLQYA